MKRKISKLLSLLLTAVLLPSLIAPAVLAAGSTNTIYLHTAEDLVELSQNCTLDSWSQGKAVYLEADIDLAGVVFSPIPTFGGTFQGQGHTISGLSISGSGNVRGLFRYIQPSGTVQDLTVEGSVTPSDRKNTLGGLVGNNQGTITNCSFVGTVAGTDSIGGLVGINEGKGQVINCSFSGSVSGEHYVGGIVGQNFGAILQCKNSGSINTTEVDTELNLDNLNQEQLNAAENVPVCTDIGGIAGFSSGVLQSCSNTGSVGYAHVGYNIGGIVGRQSGYLDGCVNSGTILGRKDVAGIAGQLEPEVRLLYQKDTLEELLDALRVLRSQMEQTRRDLHASSDSLSTQLQVISDRTDEAQDAIRILADSATEWANGNIEEINLLTARLSWLTDELSPILKDTAPVLDLTEALADQLQQGMEELQRAGERGSDAADQVQKTLESLQTASAHGRQSLSHLQSAIDHLRKVLGKPEFTQEALEEVGYAAAQLFQDLSDTAQTISQLVTLWRELDDKINLSPEESDALQAALDSVQDSLEQAKTAAHALSTSAAHLLLPSIHPEEWNTALQEFQAAGASLSSAFRALSQTLNEGNGIVPPLKKLFQQMDRSIAELREAGDTMEEISSQASQMSRQLSDVFQELSEKPTISFLPISSTLQAQGDALDSIFSALRQDGEALQETVSSGTDTVSDNLESINTQFGAILDLLQELIEGPEEGDGLEERFEDISDEKSGATDTGFLSNAQNTGHVEGDLNVGGIAGAMAIEYDFDPEDDLIQEGERSLDFRYQTKAIVSACINTGEVTSRQNYVGGIIGLMDLGRVSTCENYGPVSSTDGDYVGGIVGASWGSIRDSWSKCRLSGGDYVGGVAGLGATLVNCHTLVTIDEGSAYLGSVAGNVDSGGTISGNTFTSERLGALDGISYAGKAEPVDFDTLCDSQGVPDLFSQLELTFVANGVTVAVVPFQYGDGIASLPEIPVKKGYSASWPNLDYTHLTASQTLEAEYTPYTSALTDGGELPEILVDGSFSHQASVHHTAQEVSWSDTHGRTYTGTAYTVTVEDPCLEQISFTVHYRLPDPEKRHALWIQEKTGWSQQSFEQDGQYLLLSSSTGEITFCVVTVGPSLWWHLLAVLPILAILVLWRAHRTKAHKRFHISS